ncbi:DNA-binding CsgD family transcriptional regulator [Thermocatellispora tengchongensis]|uniref:DNA-binding CsgD family transcriptional regulator n=1 Tax=Thermocatellispora tengchongensis TaxID=1073253 RepID=A0A840PQW7_9ACTN|nr:helix-turn-helix transcriptional regulator [Thermocatellispora tengchongensis]MBB5140161.1 DNA-binding CsgD family transcriptional regulator [Thermocatellispora tengchongensis]
MGGLTARPDRVVHELRTLMDQGIAGEHLGAAISAAIAPWIPHDALRLVGTSPATGLGQGSFSFWHRYERDLAAALLAHRHTHGDPHRPSSLVRRQVPVAVAGADERTRRTFAACGASCELRLLLRDRRGVWGLLGLVRARDARPFTGEDLRRAALLGPALMTALRRYVTAGPLAPTMAALPAGVIVVGADRAIRAVTPQAQAWLDRLRCGDRHGVHAWLADMFVTALAMDAGEHVRGPDGARPIICAPAARYGRWLAVEGQALDEEGTGDVAVVIQSAAGGLMLPSFCDWYAITPRERRVLELLCRGAAPKQIARLLDLSAHTVNDHLKAVFRKTGAAGRDELMAAFTT